MSNMHEDEPVNDTNPLQEGSTAAVTNKPAAVEPPTDSATPPAQLTRWRRFSHGLKRWWRNPKARYGALGGLLLVIVVLLAIPVSRYQILGLALKKDTLVLVSDSQSNQPVSGVKVVIDGKQFQTDSKGRAGGKLHLGSSTLQASKKYYRSFSGQQTVTFSRQHNTFRVSLTALGRQVPVKVVNKITGKPLENAVLTIDHVTTKTSKDGLAIVVVAPGATSQKANLSFAGYNTSAITIAVGDTLMAANTFGLTPSGTIYFLSNKTGKIDVVKSNLDGSNRQTVLAGTGNEDPSGTSLLASRDWKYLALLSKRDAGDKATASVYLIDTTNGDKLTTIDEGDAYFTLVGWSDHRFVYQANRNGYSNWQSGAQALKSFNAETLKLTTIDQTTAEGTGDYDYGFNSFSGVYILDDELVYTKWLYTSSYNNHLTGKSASLFSVKADGSNRHSVKDFAVPDGTNYGYALSLSLYEPDGLYVSVPIAGGGTQYYEYEAGKLAAKPALTDNTFSKDYATYLISPSADSTFWSELRDGKNSLFVGDKDAANSKQIASLSSYKPYGWYSDNYLLVSKASSELYIMPRDGSAPPLKVTDYYKPDLNYQNYGGGYGGL